MLFSYVDVFVDVKKLDAMYYKNTEKQKTIFNNKKNARE